jgi:hypothetical protein
VVEVVEYELGWTSGEAAPPASSATLTTGASYSPSPASECCTHDVSPSSSPLLAFAARSSCTTVGAGVSLLAAPLAFCLRRTASLRFAVASLTLTSAVVAVASIWRSCASTGVEKPALVPMRPCAPRSMRLLSDEIQL